MSNRIEAIVTPDLLIWARESAGFTKGDAAHKLGVKLQRLEDWEGGVGRPTIKQLRRLGQLYKRPIAVFYLDEKPIDFQPLRDFRRIPGSSGFQQPVQLNFEIRQAIYRRQVALNLIEDLYGESPGFEHKINITDDPEKVGSKIRNILKVDAEKQKKASGKYGAINLWRAAIEGAGVLVFQSTGVDVAEMRGFSINEFSLPVILLNGADTTNGRVFTLLHEFAHIMLKEGGICDLNEDYDLPPENRRIEVFCNHVAGAALIPRQELLNNDIVIQRSKVDDWSDNELSALTKRFNVSVEVVLRRLLICGLTTKTFYKYKRDGFHKRYEMVSKKPKKGGPSPDTKTISRAGRAFVKLVLDSYYQEKITSSDLSDYLEIRLKHLPKVEDKIMSKPVRFGGLF
ncbi:MAG: XRE family transcriptional regulator [Euryarchaeota archaeon]|nr:XRE family transcriptional regulator [Euryarchaeota archaeon]